MPFSRRMAYCSGLKRLRHCTSVRYISGAVGFAIAEEANTVCEAMAKHAALITPNASFLFISVVTVQPGQTIASGSFYRCSLTNCPHSAISKMVGAHCPTKSALSFLPAS